jgi:hypothetical protein
MPLLYKIPGPSPVQPALIPSPLSVGGCGIWLDSTDTSAASMTFSSGQNISVWKDKSGNANNFSALQGVTSVVTDGPYSVVNFTSTGSSATQPILKSANQITWTSSSAFFVVCKVTTESFAYVVAFPDIDAGDFSIRISGGILTGTQGAPGNNDDLTNSYHVNGHFNPNFTSSTYLNTYAIIDTVAPITVAGVTSYVTLSSLFENRVFIGNIGEFIYYPAGVSTAQRQDIEAYLANKWGLTGSLPADFPTRPINTMRFIQQPGLTWHDSRVLNLQNPAPLVFISAGLVFHLDAGNASSYSGSGSTWNDLAGSGLTTTLFNSPTFSSANGGYLSFVPSSSQYAQTSASLSGLPTWTIEVWHYYNGITTDGAPCILTDIYGADGVNINFFLGSLNTTAPGLQVGFYKDNFFITTGETLSANGWYHLVGTYDGSNVKLYVNNVLTQTQAQNETPTSGGVGIRFMRTWNFQNYWGGGLAVVRIYNGAKGASDVSTNYNGSKARFGLS